MPTATRTRYASLAFSLIFLLPIEFKSKNGTSRRWDNSCGDNTAGDLWNMAEDESHGIGGVNSSLLPLTLCSPSPAATEELQRCEEKVRLQKEKDMRGKMVISRARKMKKIPHFCHSWDSNTEPNATTRAF